MYYAEFCDVFIRFDKVDLPIDIETPKLNLETDEYLRNMIINLVLIVAAVVADAHAGLLKDVIDFGCLKDSNCGGAEFCDRDFPNPLGRCTAGLEAGSKCLLSRYCASKKCNFFRCSPRLTVNKVPENANIFFNIK